MATYKSGDILGYQEISYLKQGSIFSPGQMMFEKYTYRLRYISQYKIWIITLSSDLPAAFNNHEVVKSATNLNSYKQFLASDFVDGNTYKILANDAALAKVNLRADLELSDDYTQDYSTPAPSVPTTATPDTNSDPELKPRFNTTYLLILGTLVLAILVVKRLKK